jgi:hypothetical protein
MATSRSRAGAISRAQQYFDNKFLDDIARRVAIKTESQKFPDPGAIAECHRYLETEMRPAFENMGFTCKGYDNPVAGQGPVLLAIRIEDSNCRRCWATATATCAIPGPVDQGPGSVDHSAYGDRSGRGTADNKGQHTLNMHAAAGWPNGRPPGFNAKFIIER